MLVCHGREGLVLSATATGGGARAGTERRRGLEEGFVRYAEVLVLLDDRRAVEVLRVGYFQHRTRADGTLDRERGMAVMAAAGEAAFGHLPFPKPPPGVVGAEHKFAQRRLDHLYRWKPTRAEIVKLRDLVNRKAGREIM